MMDPILEELYATKEEIARENGYDVRRMSASANQFVEGLKSAGWKFNILPAPSSARGSPSHESRLRLSKVVVHPRKKREVVLA